MIKPFEAVWFIEIALAVLATVLISVLFRKNSIEEKRKFLRGFSIGCLVFLLAYKIYLPFDPGYETNIFLEIPIQICNLSIVLSLFALTKKGAFLRPVMYYFCLLGPIFGLLFPVVGFTGVPFWYPRCIGYYGMHLSAMMLPVLFVTLGVYEPKIKDILIVLIFGAVFGLFAHLLNVVLRATALAPEANYWFTYGLPGNVLLDLVWSLIPVPYLYELPLGIALVVLDLGLYGLSRIGKHRDGNAAV